MHFCLSEMSLATMQTLSGELLELLADPESNQGRIHWLGRRLYQGLFGPIARLLDPSRGIAVHCSGDLRCVPLGLLESEDGELLLDRFTSWHATDFPWHASKAKITIIPRTAQALIVDIPGVRAPEAKTSSSPASDELMFVAKAFPHHDKICDVSATREQFDRLATQAELLHCRMVLSGGAQGPELELAPDSVGGETLPLLGYGRHTFSHGALAVMDVECTPQGEEGGLSLWQTTCHALHYAGIANVVIPRWRLSAEERRAFLELFYADLKDGISTREAFQRATVEMRATSKWRHPHYWAGFALSVSHI
jgi:CHAT domain-containing protein